MTTAVASSRPRSASRAAERPASFSPSRPAGRRTGGATRLRRDAVERLLGLAAHLAPAERELVERVLGDGLSAAAVARLSGERPRRVQNRLQRILARLRTPEYRYIVAQRETWPRTRRRVAELCLLQNRPRREAASILGCSVWAVRRELDAVRVLLEQAEAMGRLG